MKEKVDRILNGESVDIAGDGANYYLSVLKDGDKYAVGFVGHDEIHSVYQLLDTKTIKASGNLLIALADELESRKRFKDDDDFYYVSVGGTVLRGFFKSDSTLHNCLIMTRNAFKTYKEAEINIHSVMDKYKELKDTGLV